MMAWLQTLTPLGLAAILWILRRIWKQANKHEKNHAYTWIAFQAIGVDLGDSKRRLDALERHAGIKTQPPKSNAEDIIRRLRRDLGYESDMGI